MDSGFFVLCPVIMQNSCQEKQWLVNGSIRGTRLALAQLPGLSCNSFQVLSGLLLSTVEPVFKDYLR